MGAILRASNEILKKGNDDIIQGAFIGNGLRTDGVNEYMQVANNVVLSPSQFSISMIIKFIQPNANVNDGFRILQKGQEFPFPNSEREYWLYWVQDKLIIVTNRFAVNGLFVSTPLLLADMIGRVLHITVTFDSINPNNWNIYINGELKQKTVSSNNFTQIFTTPYPLTFGSVMVNGTYTRFSQMIFYSTVMLSKLVNQSEVNQLYESDNRDFTGLQANLIADWRFDEKIGNIVRDYSPNELNGNIVNYTAGEQSLGVSNKHMDYLGSPILF